MEDFLVSLAQVVWTVHNICKVRGSNDSGHHKEKTFMEDVINKYEGYTIVDLKIATNNGDRIFLGLKVKENF